MKIQVVEPGHEILTPLREIDGMSRMLEQAGRTCYKSEDKITEDSADKFVRAIIKSGHESVIEHGVITVRLIGSRSWSHQQVRHRIAAISQESQRYCDYGKLGFKVICPPTIAELRVGGYETIGGGQWVRSADLDAVPAVGVPNLSVNANDYLNSVSRSYEDYLTFRGRGVPPEDAREVLPNGTKTEVVVTYNLRTWRHVFKERALNRHAQWQIRGIMLGVLGAFATLMPYAFEDLLAK